ncbi:MAG: hypothetical protein AB1611_18470 [bacterium]
MNHFHISRYFERAGVLTVIGISRRFSLRSHSLVNSANTSAGLVKSDGWQYEDSQ